MLAVIHPNVRDYIDEDLDILRLLADVIENLPFSYTKRLKWLNLPGMADEFASMLQIQLDLRTEAMHLDKFNENFVDYHDVVFPKVRHHYGLKIVLCLTLLQLNVDFTFFQVVKEFDAHPDVLIETFCEGIPVSIGIVYELDIN